MVDIVAAIKAILGKRWYNYGDSSVMVKEK